MADKMVFRLIAVFEATGGKEAKKLADAAVKALGPSGKLDRITTRRETWGAVPDEDEGGE